jgi:hypothetical protein
MNEDSLKTIESECWQPSQGWNGLLPGFSELKDAVKILGDFENESRVSNGKQYEFANGTVQVLVLNSESKIAKIRVLSDYPNKEYLPSDIDQAHHYFGFLEQTDFDESGTLIFSAPGVRLACDAFADPHTIEWIEFNDLDKLT